MREVHKSAQARESEGHSQSRNTLQCDSRLQKTAHVITNFLIQGSTAIVEQFWCLDLIATEFCPNGTRFKMYDGASKRVGEPQGTQGLSPKESPRSVGGKESTDWLTVLVSVVLHHPRVYHCGWRCSPRCGSLRTAPQQSSVLVHNLNCAPTWLTAAVVIVGLFLIRMPLLTLMLHANTKLLHE